MILMVFIIWTALVLCKKKSPAYERETAAGQGDECLRILLYIFEPADTMETRDNNIKIIIRDTDNAVQSTG